MDLWVKETIRNVDECANMSDFKQTLVRVRKRLGFDHIFYAVRQPVAFTRQKCLSISDFPAQWLQRYVSETYVRVDPVVQHCFNSHLPYCWDRYEHHNDEKTQKFVNDVRNHNLLGGLSIGLQSFDGIKAIVSMAKYHPLSSNSNEFLYSSTVIHSLLPYIGEKMRQLLEYKDKNKDSTPLSAREKECLLWAADGKTTYEISIILKISESTVAFHLSNSIKKLHVSNRNQAIAKAVLQSQISPQLDNKKFLDLHS